MTKKFALIGAAGYIAPKHMQAIQDVGGELIAALDPHDSVGILDKYAPNCQFFTEEHRFRRFLNKNRVNYVSICSPNYLHYDHIALTMDSGAKAICEKPLVINPENLGIMLEKCPNHVHPILQLRYHPIIQDLSKIIWPAWVRPGSKDKVVVEYNTCRGPWYQYSWKGDPQKSGGLAVNIGIHLFDMLIYLFGEPEKCRLLKKDQYEITGNLEFKYAEVYFHLGIQEQEIRRTLEINREVFDLNFENVGLHTKCYQEILAGRGLTIEDAEPSLLLARRIENEI